MGPRPHIFSLGLASHAPTEKYFDGRQLEMSSERYYFDDKAF
jgi:hypothetical protein